MRSRSAYAQQAASSQWLAFTCLSASFTAIESGQFTSFGQVKRESRLAAPEEAQLSSLAFNCSHDEPAISIGSSATRADAPLYREPSGRQKSSWDSVGRPVSSDAAVPWTLVLFAAPTRSTFRF